MPSRKRRRLLRTSATALAAVGLSGCIGGNGADDEQRQTATTDDTATTNDAATTDGNATDDGTTRKTTDENAPGFDLPASEVKLVADAHVGVANSVARSAIAYDSIMGSGGVLAPDGAQFVVADAQSTTGSTADAAEAPPYDAFELVAGGERFPAVTIEQRTRGAYTTSLAGRGAIQYASPYARSGGKPRVGWVAFELPSSLTAASPAIRCRYGGDAARWRLPDEVTTALGRRQPRFELRSFDATAVDEQTVELSLTAENVADAAGEFLAAVYWPTTIADDDESHIVRASVAPNARVEWSKTVDAQYADSRDGEVTATVEGVVAGTTTVSLARETTRTGTRRTTPRNSN